MLKLLGIMDLLTAIALLATHYGWISSTKILFIFILYLLIKGYAFKGDIASTIDMIIAGYMILILFGVHTFITLVAVIYLLQKAIFSLVA